MAVERDGGSCTRIAVSIFAVLYWGLACAHIGLGLVMLLDPQRNYILNLVHFSENDPFLKVSAYMAVVTGCAQLLVGFLGLCGAINRNRFLLIVFVVFLILNFLADITIGTLSVLYKDKFSNNYMETYLYNMTNWRYSRDRWAKPVLDTIQFYIFSVKENLREIVKSSYGISLDSAENRKMTEFVDKLQFYEKCCGSLGPSDFIGSRWAETVNADTFETEAPLFPVSCCTQIIGASALNPLAKSYARCQQYGANRQWRYSTLLLINDEPDNEQMLECCGGTSAKDYKDSFWYITNNLRGTRSFVPPSCCKQAQNGRYWAPSPIDPMCITYYYDTQAFMSSVNAEGCHEKLQSWFNTQIWIFVGFGFGSAAFIMLGILLSWCLVSKIRAYFYVKNDY